MSYNLDNLPDFERVGNTFVFKGDFNPRWATLDWKAASTRKGTLYVLESGGYHKIGKTTDFKKRFAAIAHSMPFEVKRAALRTVPLPGLAYAEAWLHKQFADRRLKGEWFAVPFGEIKAALPWAVRRAQAYADCCRAFYLDEERATASKIQSSAPRIDALLKQFEAGAHPVSVEG
jgi:hypothetical protein